MNINSTGTLQKLAKLQLFNGSLDENQFNGNIAEAGKITII